MAAKKEHYVNNKDFLEAMTAYKKEVDKAKRQKKDKPLVSDYIGSCFLKIANHLSYRPNFINYTYRQEMVSDGIENCLQYIHNFNPEKSKNPFSYFTQIIYYAFLRRIQKEKKQTHVKHMLIQSQEFIQSVNNEGDDTIYPIEGGFDPHIMVPDEAVYKPKKKDSVEKLPKGLESFMEDNKCE